MSTAESLAGKIAANGAASDRDQSRFPVFDLQNPETGFDPAKPFGQAIGARMHDSAPWKTEETIVGLPSLLVLSVFSRFGGCHLSLPCVSLRRRQNTHRYLRPPIFPGRECLAETFFASSPCPAAASAARTLLSWHADPLYTDVMSETATLDTESEILEQVIESDTAGMSPEAAQALLRFRFNTAAVARMNELAEKNRQGTIAPSERALLERYLRVGNFLNLIHAKARCALAEPASPAS